jgi:hypothetical protein
MMPLFQGFTPIFVLLETSFETYLMYFGGFLLFAFIVSRFPKSMSRKKQQADAHHYFHFEDFQLSAQEFYKIVEKILDDRAFPDVDTEIKQLNMGGFFSPQRDYLVIRGGDLEFYICAAPFGKNFFISYFLKTKEMGSVEAFFTRLFGSSTSKSFYEIDSQAMFQAGAKSAIMKAIQQVTESRGVRKLQDHELIPMIA